MSELSIQLHWHREEASLTPRAYSAAHTVVFNDSYDVIGDAAPALGGDPVNVNPEQTLVASLSSCHMMTFLALAAKAGWPVASYHDHAVGHISRNPKGKMAVTRLELNPVVRFDTGFSVSEEDLAAMQDRAHRYCFVANSLADWVEVSIG